MIPFKSFVIGILIIVAIILVIYAYNCWENRYATKCHRKREKKK